MLRRILPLSAIAMAAMAAPAAAQQGSPAYPSRALTCHDHLAVIDSYIDERGARAGTDITSGYARATAACQDGKGITALNEIEDLRVALGIPADDMNRRVAQRTTTTQTAAVNRFSCLEHVQEVNTFLLYNQEQNQAGNNPRRQTIESTHEEAYDDARAGRDAECFAKVAWNRRLLGMPTGDAYALDAGNVIASLGLAEDIGYVLNVDPRSRNTAVALVNNDMRSYSTGQEVPLPSMASTSTVVVPNSGNTTVVAPSGSTVAVTPNATAVTTGTQTAIAPDPDLAANWWR